MRSDAPTPEQRVARAAEDALAAQQYVSAVDVLLGTRLLEPSQVEQWRKGRIPFLEAAIQARPAKVRSFLSLFQQWGQRKDLVAVEAEYRLENRGGTFALRFTETGDREAERLYRVHYISPAVSEDRREKLQARLSEPAGRVVFWTLRDSRCSECGAELPSDSFLTMEAGQHSRLSAVVVRFSRTRKRYERQGVLVEEPALCRAEEECASDAPERARTRERAAAARQHEDREFAEAIAARLLELLPGCPPEEARRVAQHTSLRGSGRVGRSAAGLDREAARRRVRDRVEEILRSWQS